MVDGLSRPWLLRLDGGLVVVGVEVEVWVGVEVGFGLWLRLEFGWGVINSKRSPCMCCGLCPHPHCAF